MICVLCGNNDAVYHGMCASCATDSIKVGFPAKLEYKECPKCGAVKVGKKWYHSHQRDSVMRGLTSSIVLPDRNFRVSESSLEELNGQESMLTVQISADSEFTFTRQSTVLMRNSQESCPVCDRKYGSYYEAILQLRFEVNSDEALLESIVSRLEDIPDRSDPNQFVTKYEKKDEGLDIYLGSRKLAEKMVSFLSSSYPGTRGQSKKLAGRKEGKDFYRFTYLYRIFNPRAGSIFLYNSETLCVQHIEGDRIIFSRGARDVPFAVSYSKLLRNGYKILRPDPELVRMMAVSKEGQITTLMNLENYSTISVKAELPLREMLFSIYEGNLFYVR